MPQSLSHVILHITFSTKDRLHLINQSIEKQLHAYIATICRNERCHAYRVGGVEDHIHIVTTLSRTMTIAKLLETLKSRSSGWIKTQGDQFQDFYWQKGYASFSVSPKDLDAVVEYVENQREHHKTESFQDELRRFLTKYEIQFDEKYVWD